MTYKEAIDLFQTKFRRKLSKGMVVKGRIVTLNYEKFDIKELMSLFGEIQMKLGNHFKLWEKYTTINLVANQYEYTIPTDLLDIKEIRLNDSKQTPVDRMSKFDIPREVDPRTLSKYTIDSDFTEGRYKGLPKGYTLYLTPTRKLLIDTIPEYSYATGFESYRLLIIYYGRLDPFDVTATSLTWTDYNDALTGTFKLLKEWHLAIVYGALAQEFSDLKYLYDEELAKNGVEEPDFFSNRLPSYLGLSK